MLKWLRKYNTWILVVGGVLLMIAFLLPQTIQELGRRRLTGPVFKYSGGSISGEEYGLAAREFEVVQRLLAASNPFQRLRAAESPDHWIMLTREADKAGLVGGPRDGEDYMGVFIEQIAMIGMQFGQIPREQAMERARKQFDEMARTLSAEARLTEDQLHQGFAKLRGIARLRMMHDRAPRYSDRRLALGAKELASSANVDYILLPADRETTAVPAPSDADIQAHFDKYKNVKSGDGEFGFGYELPDRFKLQWLTIHRDTIKKAILPDVIEIEKRFLRQYPTGEPPAGIDAAAERSKISDAVVNEQADKIVKTADQTIRAEIEKIKRRLESDGDYKKLPADWTTPSLDAIAALVVTRVQELHSTSIPKPIVTNEDRWVSQSDVSTLPGIGTASLAMGSRSEPFSNLPMLAKELAGSKSVFMQAGLPFADAVTDGLNNRYYFMLTAARKRSAPDTLAEVRDAVVRDLRKLAGYERLLAKIDSIRATAGTAGGLETLAKAAPGAEGEAARDISVSMTVVDANKMTPSDPGVDSEPLRKEIMGVAVTVDPTVDPATLPLPPRVVVRPVPKSLGVFVGRVMGWTPVTIERFRTITGSITQQLQRQELPPGSEGDPFSLAAMEKRLNVEYLDGRKTIEEAKKEGAKPGA